MTIRCGVQVAEALGDVSLEALVLDVGSSAATEVLPAEALFGFVGAVPHTEWLDGYIDVDAHGFVITGQDSADWLETSLSGVFAAGDVRSGSIKRVAVAVGEGSTAAMLARTSLQPAT